MSSLLFSPLKIRGIEFKNRVWVSPMCQYSAVDGLIGEWHRAHLESFATGGAGLIMVEATGVNPVGRISIACPGLWEDRQAEAFRPIINFAHSQGSRMGIQLAHAGRKASTMRPWDDHLMATPSEGGWTAVAPSAIAFDGYPVPHELTISEIEATIADFVSAAKRAISVGFDVLEIHAAHGYLIHEFLSPLTNLRTDLYGGDLAGRTRLLREIVARIRSEVSDSTPLFVRISATDWAEGGWDVDQSSQLAKDLAELGADLIDVSSGGNIPGVKMTIGPGYQVPFAEEIRNASGVLTSSVGLITDAHQAEEILQAGKADAVMLGRQMLRNPRWALAAAEALGEKIAWPLQLERARTLH